VLSDALAAVPPSSAAALTATAIKNLFIRALPIMCRVLITADVLRSGVRHKYLQVSEQPFILFNGFPVSASRASEATLVLRNVW
jgi:hypothetical protein